MQSELPLMGGAVSIGRQIIDSGYKSEGTSESARALGYETLDDSLGPEVLALLAGGHHTELSRSEVVALGVIGGLFVSYLR